MTKLFHWAMLAIELRCEDVVTRRDKIEEQKHDREVAQSQSDDRQAKLDAQLEDAKNVSKNSLSNKIHYSNSLQNGKMNRLKKQLKKEAKEKKEKIRMPQKNLHSQLMTSWLNSMVSLLQSKSHLLQSQMLTMITICPTLLQCLSERLKLYKVMIISW